MTHELLISNPASGWCSCGSTFQAYRSARQRTEAQLTDEVLDQFNAHLAAQRHAGRAVT